MQEAGRPEHSLAARERGRPGLYGSEEDADQSLSADEGEERGRHQSIDDGVSRPLGRSTHQQGRAVEREQAAEHGERRSREDQGRGRIEECRSGTDESRSETTTLVGSPLVREGGVDEAAVIAGLIRASGRDGPPPDPGQRSDLRHRETSRSRCERLPSPRHVLHGQPDDENEAGCARESLRQDEARLADPVCDGAGDRCADGVRERSDPAVAPPAP